MSENDNLHFLRLLCPKLSQILSGKTFVLNVTHHKIFGIKKTRSKQSLFSNYPPVAWVELHFTKCSRGGLVLPKEELDPTFAFYRQALYLAPTSIFR